MLFTSPASGHNVLAHQYIYIILHIIYYQLLRGMIKQVCNSSRQTNLFHFSKSLSFNVRTCISRHSNCPCHQHRGFQNPLLALSVVQVAHNRQVGGHRWVFQNRTLMVNGSRSQLHWGVPAQSYTHKWHYMHHRP